MFMRVGWALTWLFAPLAGLTVFGVAAFASLIGYEELAPIALIAAFALTMWLALIWAVARLVSGRVRGVYLGGCAAFAIAAFAISCFPLLSGPKAGSEQVSVDLIKPPKVP